MSLFSWFFGGTENRCDNLNKVATDVLFFLKNERICRPALFAFFKRRAVTGRSRIDCSCGLEGLPVFRESGIQKPRGGCAFFFRSLVESTCRERLVTALLGVP